LGYFNIVGRSSFTLYDRASGTFKDPNVLAAYLLLPALFSLQAVVADPLRKAFRNALALGIMSIAILLAFSRAGWGLFLLTSIRMLVLMFIPSDTQRLRARIVLVSTAAVFAVVVLLMILLSFDQ